MMTLTDPQAFVKNQRDALRGRLYPSELEHFNSLCGIIERNLAKGNLDFRVNTIGAPDKILVLAKAEYEALGWKVAYGDYYRGEWAFTFQLP